MTSSEFEAPATPEPTASLPATEGKPQKDPEDGASKELSPAAEVSGAEKQGKPASQRRKKSAPKKEAQANEGDAGADQPEGTPTRPRKALGRKPKNEQRRKNSEHPQSLLAGLDQEAVDGFASSAAKSPDALAPAEDPAKDAEPNPQTEQPASAPDAKDDAKQDPAPAPFSSRYIFSYTPENAPFEGGQPREKISSKNDAAFELTPLKETSEGKGEDGETSERNEPQGESLRTQEKEKAPDLGAPKEETAREGAQTKSDGWNDWFWESAPFAKPERDEEPKAEHDDFRWEAESAEPVRDEAEAEAAPVMTPAYGGQEEDEDLEPYEECHLEHGGQGEGRGGRQSRKGSKKDRLQKRQNAAKRQAKEELEAEAEEDELEQIADESEAPDSFSRRRKRRGRRGGRGHSRKVELMGGERARTIPITNPDDESEESSRPKAVSPLLGYAAATAAQRQTPIAREETELEAHGEERSCDSSYARRPMGKRRMYISVLPGEQVEVAITNNGILDEYYLDMLHQKKLKGNIYRGIIQHIDPDLQAAFIDFGVGKNGFLQGDEIHPEYYITHPSPGVRRPPIQNVLRPGQELLVQVVKEETGNKGAFLTTWISLAGRFLVLTPGQEQIAISRKVSDEGERARLRELMTGIDPGEDLGVIIRTVSAGVTRATLKNDLLYLKRTWSDVRKRATEVVAPACVYTEPGLPERAVRDYLTNDVCEVWVDHAEVAKRIRETVALLFPHKKDLVRLHCDRRHSMWERFSLRRQLDQIYSREVLMPSGGRLVFDQTEALMAIDVNSGKISGKGNFEAMAYKTNMEAAATIARQLKLRDVGGQVVIDFIEMRDPKHVFDVERCLRTSMSLDRARHDFCHMSSFGLLELVRQRTGTSAISISMEPCPACGGTGLRRNLEWQALHALRDLARVLRFRTASPCRYELPQELGLYLLNHKRDTLKELEQQFGKSIEIVIKV